ncbi:MAG: TPM domain-containing protein [Candidatus Omnitrophota bacterium]
MHRRWLVVLLGIFLFSKVLFAENVPKFYGWVNDFANVVSREYRDKLTALIQELEEKASVEIAVVTVESIAPYDERGYARLLFDNWRPGKKGKDNGVLVLLAIKERRWRIETGYGVEGILPDGLCGELGRKYMVPYFKKGKYGEGLYYGVAAIAKVITKDAKTSISNLKRVKFKKTTQGKPIFLYFFIPLFFFFWNLPWSFIIGLPFTLLFALALFLGSPILGILVIAGYLAALIARYNYWSKLPSDKRKSFFGPQSYGGTWSGGYAGGGFGGGGFGGGFGGGCGGGGGAGGGF